MRQAVKQLHKQVNSLAEIVLENIRGLNLLFIEQGGLCAALEECCFYANISGVIIETLDQVEREAKEQEKLYYNLQGWYDKLFNWNPELASILAGITGLILMIIILVLSLGMCLINWGRDGIQSSVNQVHMMISDDPVIVSRTTNHRLMKDYAYPRD